MKWVWLALAFWNLVLAGVLAWKGQWDNVVPGVALAACFTLLYDRDNRLEKLQDKYNRLHRVSVARNAAQVFWDPR